MSFMRDNKQQVIHVKSSDLPNTIKPKPETKSQSLFSRFTNFLLNFWNTIATKTSTNAVPRLVHKVEEEVLAPSSDEDLFNENFKKRLQKALKFKKVHKHVKSIIRETDNSLYLEDEGFYYPEDTPQTPSPKKHVNFPLSKADTTLSEDKLTLTDTIEPESNETHKVNKQLVFTPEKDEIVSVNEVIEEKQDMEMVEDIKEQKQVSPFVPEAILPSTLTGPNSSYKNLTMTNESEESQLVPAIVNPTLSDPSKMTFGLVDTKPQTFQMFGIEKSETNMKPGSWSQVVNLINQ